MTFMILLCMIMRGCRVVSLHPNALKAESDASRVRTKLAAAKVQVDALKLADALLEEQESTTVAKIRVAKKPTKAAQLHVAKTPIKVSNMNMFAQKPTKAKTVKAQANNTSKRAKLHVGAKNLTKMRTLQGDVNAPLEANEATSANFVTVTSVDHAKGKAHVGEYFNFDRPNAWTSGHAVDVMQCRDGQQIWSGKIIWWKGLNGGSTGNSHGRRNSNPSAGQWQVNDTATDSTCQAESEGIGEAAAATAASLSSDLMASEQQGFNDVMASFRPDAIIDDVPQDQKRNSTASKSSKHHKDMRLTPVATTLAEHNVAMSTRSISNNAVVLPMAVLLLILLVILGLFCEDRDDSFTDRLAKGGKI